MTIDSLPTDTRLRLIEAAANLFAVHGYDGVSTRTLARTAGVNIAAIGYHFGGKKDLYTAVIKHVVEESTSVAKPIFDGINARVATAENDRQKLAETVAFYVRAFVRGLGSTPQVRTWIALIQQEFAHPSEALPIILEGRIIPMHRAFTSLVAAATGRSADDAATIVRAHAVVGQMLVFFLARAVILARTGWSGFGPDELSVMEHEVSESVLGSLGLPLSPIEENRT